MITTARIHDEIKPAGLDWISCLRAGQIQELAEGPLQMSLFDERDSAAITAPDYPGERLVACRNALLAAGRTRKREALLVAAERALSRIATATRRRHAPLRGPAEIGLAVGAVINARKMAKHFELTITDASFSYRRRADSIEREARLDGISIIRTSLSAEAMSGADAVRADKDLARVERAFRALKSVDLQIRPVQHWITPRVRGHVFLCMMAYYVEWHLREAWTPILFHDHDPQAAEQERSSPVAAAEISPAAKRKRGRRRSDGGLPISSFAGLMAHLATQTLNVVVIPNPKDAAFTTITKPAILQNAAFSLLVPTSQHSEPLVSIHGVAQCEHPERRGERGIGVSRMINGGDQGGE